MQLFKTNVRDNTRCNVILDLDLTIIESLATDEIDWTDDFKSKLQAFEEWKSMEDIYIVVGRPGLQTFLDFLFDNFNVSVWTAASKDYAMFIINTFIMTKDTRKLDWILFDYHCDISEKKVGDIKKISLLWTLFRFMGYNRSNTVIIDDNYDDVYKHQPASVVLCPPFEVLGRGSGRTDNFLTRLTPLLLQFKENCQESNVDDGDQKGGPAPHINRIINHVATAKRKRRSH